MSRFMSRNTAALDPYVPGEQPQGEGYIKLNTNECPYPPAPGVGKVLDGAWKGFPLYPDPEAGELRQAMAEVYGLARDQVFVANGSDEVLAFSYLAFFDKGDSIYYPDPSYGFYPVYASLFGLTACPLPLGEDFSLNPRDYFGLDGNILIANPNAPSSMAIGRGAMEEILRANPHRLVIVDEAYVDFADDVTALPLLERYENLLIIGTFSKSRALAGLRLGYAFSRPEHIAALERIKFSFNPYNVNRVTQQAGIAAVGDTAYLAEVVGKIKATRARIALQLRELGLRVLESSTNFLFVSHPVLGGREFARALRAKKILVRYFDTPRTADFVRVSIGTDKEMDAFVQAVREIE